MKPDFPNDISKIEIDVPVPEPVITIEEHRVMLIKKFNRINIAVFSFLLAGFSAFLMFGKRPVISETENRKLTEFPEFSFKNLVSGTFTNGLADYYNDTVPMRKYLKNSAASIKELAGIELGGVKVYTVNTKPSGNNTPAAPVTSTTARIMLA